MIRLGGQEKTAARGCQVIADSRETIRKKMDIFFSRQPFVNDRAKIAVLIDKNLDFTGS